MLTWWDTIYSAYVLIKTLHDHEHAVYNHLFDDMIINDIKPIFNDSKYDIIVKLKSDSLEAIQIYISQRIKDHAGVKQIKTYC